MLEMLHIDIEDVLEVASQRKPLKRPKTNLIDDLVLWTGTNAKTATAAINAAIRDGLLEGQPGYALLTAEGRKRLKNILTIAEVRERV
jgi:hypothetical protein